MSPTPDADRRPRASVIGSIVQGWSLAFHAPWVTGGLLCVVQLVALPSGPEVIVPTPAAAPSMFILIPLALDNLLGCYRAFVNVIRPLEVTPVAWSTISGVLVYVAIWLFLAGGVVDRLARGRAVGSGPFFAACGVHAVRFLRLAVVILPVLAGLVFVQRAWLPGLIAGASAPRPGPLEHAAFLAASVIASLVIDFAVVRIVVEDRYSALSALVASVRFVRRRFLRLLALYLINVAVLAVLIQLLIWSMPIATSVPLLPAGLLILVSLWGGLAFIGSQIVFFQNELAHAHYTAAPVPTWPDSPAVEAIENLKRNRA